jgi:hypothetical protein
MQHDFLALLRGGRRCWFAHSELPRPELSCETRLQYCDDSICNREVERLLEKQSSGNLKHDDPTFCVSRLSRNADLLGDPGHFVLTRHLKPPVQVGLQILNITISDEFDML